ncbi:amino acid permease [Dactylosporangium sp. NPDC000555]|uniref:APC family permease n=1 Tax=Dactylosporangium sp. NPDC000555 TaxID=3154260 RepID=UPI0033259C52
MTVPQGAALSVGAVLGTGVIALPALAAQAAGPASLIAWAVLVALSVPLASTFAALGARYPDSGGVATYARTAFGHRAAAVVGWSFYFAVPVGAPAAALFGGAYVAAAVGGGTRTALLTAAALMLTVTVGNLGGVRVSGRLQLGLAALLVALLLTATLTALPHASAANLHPFAPHGWWAIGPAAAVLVWGFAGWEAVTSLAADFRHPRRDLPRATAIALVVVAVLYLGIAAASILVLGPAAAAPGAGGSEAPLAELLAIGIAHVDHQQVRAIAAGAAVLLTLGAMNAYYAGAAKLGAALGRDGALPAWFGRGAAPGSVPRRSLLVVALLGAGSLALVAATGTGTRALVLLASGCFVLVYLVGSAAAIRLLPRGSLARRCAIVALLSAVGLLVLTGWYVLGTLVIAAGALLYARRGSAVEKAAETSADAVDSVAA